VLPDGEAVRKARSVTWLARRALILALVALAAAAGAVGALAIVQSDRRLDGVGTVRLSVDPGHRGALDVYVPLVDWGVRFAGVRLPVRLSIDVRSIDREAAVAVAQGGSVDVTQVRNEAADAVRGFLVDLLLITLGMSLGAGVLVALAVRSARGPRLRVTLATAVGTALAVTAAVALLLPPRLGATGQPEYYANGPDIPRALETIQTLRATASRLDEELDDQLVGLARLVLDPGRREPLAGLPRLTVASDLHNNALAIPALERAGNRGPVFFVGDLTDSGSPLEGDLVSRVVHTGRPFLFVAGNHDSDTLSRRLARSGAIVLTRRGRLEGDGRHGPEIVHAAGLRVAGYDDPLMRLSSEGYRDHGGVPNLPQQQQFLEWMVPLLGKVDVIMVHSPAVAQLGINYLKANPPKEPLVLLVGHTHIARLDRFGPVTILNGGTIGGGGASNVADNLPIGLGALTYRTKPSFVPVAADLIDIDPGNGSATARRTRLDDVQPPDSG
jgi:predicted phosphodiesterase